MFLLLCSYLDKVRGAHKTIKTICIHFGLFVVKEEKNGLSESKAHSKDNNNKKKKEEEKEKKNRRHFVPQARDNIQFRDMH